MQPEDRPKTAFASHKGLFEFTVMPFGLSNSPATFERLMEIVLCGLQWEKCLVYLDDVIVFGKTFQETLTNLRSVFERFKKAKLKLKPKKCILFKDEVSFLGHVVSANGIQCDPQKIAAIKEWPVPENISDVRSFLGLASYYRKFIYNFSQIAYPLTRLTQKNRHFEWSEESENAFNTLKRLLTESPVLSYPDIKETFILDTDASAYGVGAVLSQVQNGRKTVIAYGSKTLSKSQRKYCTTYRELLAVVLFIKNFKHYLYGRHFLLRTDHSSLLWLKNFKEPEGMLARWLSFLETYDFEIKHRKGSLHVNADGLSRRPLRRCKRLDCSQCYDNILQNDNDNSTEESDRQTSAYGETVAAVTNKQSQENESDLNLFSSNWLGSDVDIKISQSEDKAIKTIRDLMLISGERPTIVTSDKELDILMKQWSVLEIKNNVLYRKWENDDKSITLQLIVPKSIRKEIMIQLHNSRLAGHLGREKTLKKIQSRFYWPGMSTDVRRWCQNCMFCQKRKPGPGIGKSPMRHVDVSAPLDAIAIDIMGPLPVTENGNQYIMVVGDYFSKWTEAYALPVHTAQIVADKLVTEFICRYGTPLRIHTDQGREFESKLFTHLCRLLEIEKSRTTPYRPQSDGMIERFNRTLQQMLAMFVNENHDDWDDHLPYLTSAYRTSVQESTVYS